MVGLAEFGGSELHSQTPRDEPWRKGSERLKAHTVNQPRPSASHQLAWVEPLKTEETQVFWAAAVRAQVGEGRGVWGIGDAMQRSRPRRKPLD